MPVRREQKPHTSLRDSGILLVEDDPNDILLLQRAFRNAHVANPLSVVKDGEEAIRYFSGIGPYANRNRYPFPFLVLLDLRLPRISGFEVLEWIRDQPGLKNLVVVVLTGSDNVPDVTKARELGANSYLVKPGTADEMVAIVKRIKGRWLVADPLPEKPTTLMANGAA